MNLARIMPGPKGHDLRNFECEKCDHVLTVTVATDPMQSEALAWLKGDLRTASLLFLNCRVALVTGLSKGVRREKPIKRRGPRRSPTSPFAFLL
jgi:hypothetical protein